MPRKKDEIDLSELDDPSELAALRSAAEDAMRRAATAMAELEERQGIVEQIAADVEAKRVEIVERITALNEDEQALRIAQAALAFDRKDLERDRIAIIKREAAVAGDEADEAATRRGGRHR